MGRSSRQQLHHTFSFRVILTILFGFLFVFASPALSQPTASTIKPLPAPARWRGLIGEYGPDDDILIILEKDGRLCALFKRKDLDVLDEVSRGVFRLSGNAAREGWRATFKRDRTGRVAYIEMRMDVGVRSVGIVAFQRRPIEPE